MLSISGVEGGDCTEAGLIIDSLNVTAHGEEMTCRADNGIVPQGTTTVGLLVQSNDIAVYQIVRFLCLDY